LNVYPGTPGFPGSGRAWSIHPHELDFDPEGAIMPEETPSNQIQPPAPQSGLSDSAAAGLSYITFIPAIIFLATAPYNRSANVRFHAWQSIFLTIAYVVIRVGLIILGHIPFMGLLLIPVSILIGLGFFVLWLIVMIKAFNGQRFKIPVIGDFAEKQANS
jgi:uncharacterized membrane protein